MKTIVTLEDLSHAEYQEGSFKSVAEAFKELQRRAEIPWNEIPNICPCTCWEKCGREYEIVEFDISSDPWRELRRLGCLKISADGIIWSDDFKNGTYSE